MNNTELSEIIENSFDNLIKENSLFKKFSKKIKPSIASEDVEEYFIDINEEIKELENFITKAPLSNFDKKTYRDYIVENGDVITIDEVKSLTKELEGKAYEGDILLNTIIDLLEEIKNSNIEDKENIEKDIKGIYEGFHKGDFDVNLTLQNLKPILESNEDLQKQVSIVDNTLEKLDFVKEIEDLSIINKITQKSFDNLVLSNKEIFNRIIQNNEQYSAKSLESFNAGDLEFLLSDLNLKISDEDRKILTNILKQSRKGDFLLKEYENTFHKDIVNLKDNLDIKSVDISNASLTTLLTTLQNDIQKAKSEEDLKVLEKMLDTLEDIKLLESKNQLSRAERVSSDLKDEKDKTSLENIDEYFANLDESRKALLKSFDVKAESAESVGEEIGDNLIEWGKDQYKNKKERIKERKANSRWNKTKANAKTNSKANSRWNKIKGLNQKFGGTALKLGSIASVGLGAYDLYDKVKSEDIVSSKSYGKTIGSTIGAIGGAIGGAFFGGAGSIAGSALGSWVGEKLGGLVGGFFDDPEDFIPKEVKSQGAMSEISYIENELKPKVLTNPEKFGLEDEGDVKEFMGDLNKYEQSLYKKVDQNNVNNLSVTTEDPLKSLSDLQTNLQTSKNIINKSNEINPIKGISNFNNTTATTNNNNPVVINNHNVTTSVVGFGGVNVTDPMTQLIR